MEKFEDMVKVETINEAKDRWNVFAKWKKRGFKEAWNIKPLDRKDAEGLVSSIRRGNYNDIEEIVIIKSGETPK